MHSPHEGGSFSTSGKMPHSKRQRKRKRAVGDEQAASSVGRPLKQTRGEESKRVDAVEHALLVQYYPKLQTLRSYVLSHLPSSSRLRRKKIASIGASNEPSSKTPDDTELHLSRFLDSTIVAESSSQEKARPEPEKRWQKWMNFSQKGDESYVTLSDGVAGAAYSQSEVSKCGPNEKLSSANWLSDSGFRYMAAIL